MFHTNIAILYWTKKWHKCKKLFQTNFNLCEKVTSKDTIKWSLSEKSRKAICKVFGLSDGGEAPKIKNASTTHQGS